MSALNQLYMQQDFSACLFVFCYSHTLHVVGDCTIYVCCNVQALEFMSTHINVQWCLYNMHA